MASADPSPDSALSDGKSPRDWACIIQEHQAFVWRYLRVLGCDPALADDLTQDTFVAVLGSKRSIARAAMRTYLRKTAASLWIKSCRRATRSIACHGIELADEAYVEFCGQDDGDSYLDALRQCVDELSERRRRVLALRYQEGRSRREVARQLGMTEDGVKSLVTRAFARLRWCIESRRASDAR